MSDTPNRDKVEAFLRSLRFTEKRSGSLYDFFIMHDKETGTKRYHIDARTIEVTRSKSMYYQHGGTGVACAFYVKTGLQSLRMDEEQAAYFAQVNSMRPADEILNVGGTKQ